MKLTVEHDAAEALRFVEQNTDWGMPFVPNLRFLADAAAGKNPLFAVRICAARTGDMMTACEVWVRTPNPDFANDEMVGLALAENPQMVGVRRLFALGEAAGLAEFAAAVAQV